MQKRFCGFISYSQKDKVWGKRLHGWLETYRIPSGVLVEGAPDRRLGRFFRDEEEMAASGDIAEIVRQAIDSSVNLIVVCSPHSARSK